MLTSRLFAQNEQPAKPPAQLAPKTVPNQVQLFIPYKQYSQEDNQRILKLYEPLRVSDVSDGMDTVGLQDSALLMNPSDRFGKTPKTSLIALWASL
jgi:hypothetical protein